MHGPPKAWTMKQIAVRLFRFFLSTGVLRVNSMAYGVNRHLITNKVWALLPKCLPNNAKHKCNYLVWTSLNFYMLKCKLIEIRKTFSTVVLHYSTHLIFLSPSSDSLPNEFEDFGVSLDSELVRSRGLASFVTMSQPTFACCQPPRNASRPNQSNSTQPTCNLLVLSTAPQNRMASAFALVF